jgi:hypothetical protein
MSEAPGTVADGGVGATREATFIFADIAGFTNKRSRGSRDEAAMDGLVVSGLTELALGALTGWPMAVAVSRSQDLGKLGIRSGARLRQWHLDLIRLGGLTAAAPRFVPDLPRKVALPLVGAWVNANAFGVLAFRPELKEHPMYKAGVAGSFISASWGFVGLAAVAWKGWLVAR